MKFILSSQSFVKNRGVTMTSVIAVIILFLTVVIAFIGLNSYSLIVDETYQALCCKDYQNSPLAMMIFYVGNKWMTLFGDDLLSLRILSRLCILVAIGIGGGYLWKKTHNILLTGVICMLSAIFANLGDMSFYNWDTGAYPIAAIGTLVLLLYIDQASLVWLMVLGFITGVMTAFRVPLIAFIGIVGIVLIVENGPKVAAKRCFIYILMVVLGLGACAVLMTGSLQLYIESFKSDNIISGHTGDILKPYIHQFALFFPRNIYCGMVTFLSILFSVLLSFVVVYRLRYLIVCQVIVLIVGLSCVLQYVSPFNGMLSGIGIPFFLVVVGWLHLSKMLWGNVVENDASNKKAKLKLIVLLMSMFLLGLGSDTAFQRWNIIAYFPMGVAVVWPLMRGKSQTVLKKIILTAMPALVLMVPFKSFRMEQASISIKVPKTSKFYGIRMEPYVVEKYYNINELVERLNTKGVSFTFGGLYDRYLYSYEFESDNSLCVPLHMYHWNEGDINLLKRIELKRDVIILGANSKRDCELLKQLYGMEIIESTPSYTVCGDKRIKEILDPSGDFKHLKE